MRASSVSGRVSTLAVVVGVGIAAATGVASADTEGSDGAGAGAGSASSSSAESTSTTSTGAGAAETSAADTAVKKAEAAEAAEAKDAAKAEKDAAAAAAKAEKEAAKQAEKAENEAAKDAEQAERNAEKAEANEAQEAAQAAEAEAAAPSEAAAPESTVEAPAAEAPEVPAPDAEVPEAEVPEAEVPVAEVTPADQDPAAPAADTESETPAKATSTAEAGGSGKSVKAEATVSPTAKTSVVESAEHDTETVTLKTVETVAPAPEVAAVAEEVDVPSAAVTSVTVLDDQEIKKKPSLGAVLKAVTVGVHRLVTGLAAVFGLTSDPNQPTGLAALVALLGWGTRRELTQTTVASTDVATVMPMAALAATPTTWVGWVTGANSINDTMARFGIYGTDLGIMWDNGITGDDPNTLTVEQRQILMAFGDTFTNAAMTTGWRNNVLLRSADNVLSNGIYVPNGIVDRPGIPDGAYSGSPMSLTIANYSRELIGKFPYTRNTQVTIIPTGAISVPGAGVNGATRQYVAFMSVKKWGAPGSWTTNYSAISYSDDNGQNWTVVPQSSVRSAGWFRSTVSYKSGNKNFQMISFVRPPEGSADAEAGYIYATGTPSGRNGKVYLARVKEADILDTTKYAYWTGKKWVTNKPSAAKPFLPKTESTFLFFKSKKDTTAGELSVQYNTYLNKYVMLYTDGSNNVVMRTSDSMNGKWSDATTLVTSSQYPGLYAPMIHPWSGTSLLKKADGSDEDPQYLYWNMSLWGDYNVALMKTDLSLV